MLGFRRPHETPRRLNHGAPQPTLDDSHETPPAPALASFDLIETAAALAFTRAALERAPIAPHIGLTIELAALLQSRGFFAVCLEDDASRSDPPVRAVYDALAWRYGFEEPAGEALARVLGIQLERLSRDPESRPLKASLWRSLASAEIEGYLAHLLRRHGFDARWAADVRDGGERWRRGLSLAQLRYVVWASVREGAAAYLRSSGESEDARDAIVNEIRRRSRWMESKPDWAQGFLPAAGFRQSILVTMFLSEVAPIGNRYWLEPPSELALARGQDSDA